ncbi:glycosyltransferase family 32 protein [Plenodomus tracheiphilus IPT5]|uniref:Glycosyltransferase family 32 protein n=1 Tax=Plenodomus tracheiphilus IPT5 TaxID=1408161 RepID=A0A6A7AN86_9PLEO|nr:glycosyltransferase family 32 protein [Plenodomus tracheiphilus IPT5]
MLRRQLLSRILASFSLLYAFYYIAKQCMFERVLDDLEITFEDFPLDYAKALKDSVIHGAQPTEFDYPSAFPKSIIPRRIHYIWFKDLYPSREHTTTMPSDGSQAPQLCQRYNPDYEIRVWNSTGGREFLEKEYTWFLPTFDGYTYPIQKVDALKYFVLYHFGGIYMDLDIACRRSLDPLLDFPAWFPKASPMGVNNDLMASTTRHPVLKRMTQQLIPYNHNWIFPYITIYRTTGPLFTSNILQEWLTHSVNSRHTTNFPKNESRHDTFFVLPRIFYSEEYTFFGHSPGGTWHGSDVATVLWFVDHPLVTVCVLPCVAAVLACMHMRGRRAATLNTASK